MGGGSAAGGAVLRWEELARVKGRPEGLAVRGAGVLGGPRRFWGVVRLVGAVLGCRGPVGLRVRCWGSGRWEAGGKEDKEGLGEVSGIWGAHRAGRGMWRGACGEFGVVELGVRGFGGSGGIRGLWRLQGLGGWCQGWLGVVLQDSFPTVRLWELLSSCGCWSWCSKENEHP